MTVLDWAHASVWFALALWIVSWPFRKVESPVITIVKNYTKEEEKK